MAELGVWNRKNVQRLIFTGIHPDMGPGLIFEVLHLRQDEERNENTEVSCHFFPDAIENGILYQKSARGVTVDAFAAQHGITEVYRDENECSFLADHNTFLMYPPDAVRLQQNDDDPTEFWWDIHILHRRCKAGLVLNDTEIVFSGPTFRASSPEIAFKHKIRPTQQAMWAKYQNCTIRMVVPR